jgi:hypothetical protein
MKKISLKRFGSNESPLLLDFVSEDNNFEKISIRILNSGGYPEFLAQEFLSHRRNAKIGDEERVWIFFDLNGNVPLPLIAFTDSLWNFHEYKIGAVLFDQNRNAGLPNVKPKVDCGTLNIQRSMILDTNLEESFTYGHNLKASSWVKLLNTLYSKKVMPRFPAILKLEEYGDENKGIKIIASLTGDFPSYSEFFLFVNRQRLV